MNTTRILAGISVVTTIALVALGIYAWQLSRRVAALEVVTAHRLAEDASPGAPAVQSLQKAMTAWREARSGGTAMTEDQAADLVQEALDDALESTLDDALDRRAEARRSERTQRFLDVAEQNIRMQVDELAADHRLTEEQSAEAVDVMVTALRGRSELRRAVMSGDLTVVEARGEGEVLREAFEEDLSRTIGAEAYEDLGRRLNGEEGWDAAPGGFRGRRPGGPFR